MRVKAIDIARELGLSKATVSLALNNKPGVNPKTRQEILECRERMEQENPPGQVPVKKEKGYVIKIIVFTRELKVAKGAELDLWTDVNAVFDAVAKSWGYVLEISYFNLLKEEFGQLEKECNQNKVAGVVLFGTELYPEDAGKFKKIQKPMVVYDCDLEDEKYPCVVVDNAGGVKMAVDYMVARGKKNLVYLSRNIQIYNYQQRQLGFEKALREHNLEFSRENQMLSMGEKIDTIYQNMKSYIDTHELPDGFIMESYHLSIGAIRAFREKGIQIPRDVSIIGIDELPDYMTGEQQLTTIRIPHTERANMVMLLLFHEITNGSSIKSRIETYCKLIEGNTVI